MEENGLSDRVRAAIQSERVPSARGLKRVRYTISEGATCVICELTINIGDVKVQALLPDPGNRLHFHLCCFDAWDTARLL